MREYTAEEIRLHKKEVARLLQGAPHRPLSDQEAIAQMGEIQDSWDNYFKKSADYIPHWSQVLSGERE